MAGVDFRRRTLLKGSMASMLSPIVLSGCSGGGAHANVLTDGEAGQAQDSVSLQQAGYRARLYTPTMITRLLGTYFIVDCWHHRIIHSRNLHAPLVRWKTLDDDIAGPHSIATDGTFHVAEDTGRHGLFVYRETAPDHFERVQHVPDVGIRPHRTLYDAEHQQFLVEGSADQSINLLEVQGGRLVRTLTRIIPELGRQYCRSITLHEGLLYFVGEADIVVYGVDRDRVSPTGSVIHLPEVWQGSNDLFFLGRRRGLFMSTPGKACAFDSVDALGRGEVQDLSATFRGTPYFVTQFDGRLWIPEITEYSALRSYPASGDAVTAESAQTLFDFGLPDEASLERKRAIVT